MRVKTDKNEPAGAIGVSCYEFCSKVLIRRSLFPTLRETSIAWAINYTPACCNTAELENYIVNTIDEVLAQDPMLGAIQKMMRMEN